MSSVDSVSGSVLLQPTAEHIAKSLGGRKSGGGWVARCPAHEDKGPSLSLTDRAGIVLVHCFAGCSQAEVIAVLRDRGLWPRKEETRTPAEKQADIEDWQEMKRQLPDAHLWQRTAIGIVEDELARLKLELFRPEPSPADWSDPVRPSRVPLIHFYTVLLQALKTADDASLVHRYREWVERAPAFTESIVRWARIRSNREMRGLRRFLREDMRR